MSCTTTIAWVFLALRQPSVSSMHNCQDVLFDFIWWKNMHTENNDNFIPNKAKGMEGMEGTRNRDNAIVITPLSLNCFEHFSPSFVCLFSFYWRRHSHSHSHWKLTILWCILHFDPFSPFSAVYRHGMQCRLHVTRRMRQSDREATKKWG